MEDDALILLSETHEQDEYGIYHTSPQGRTVFCRKTDVTRSEFYQAGRSGLTPQLVIITFFANYEGEEVCIYHDQPYHIYRTYRVPGTDDLELYLELKGGTNGAASNQG